MNKWIFKYQVRRVFGIRPIKEKSLIETEGHNGTFGLSSAFSARNFSQRISTIELDSGPSYRAASLLLCLWEAG